MQRMQNPYADLPHFRSDLKSLIGFNVPCLTEQQIARFSVEECQQMSQIMNAQGQVLMRHIQVLILLN